MRWGAAEKWEAGTLCSTRCGRPPGASETVVGTPLFLALDQVVQSEFLYAVSYLS
jgi:hypothetical protein